MIGSPIARDYVVTLVLIAIGIHEFDFSFLNPGQKRPILTGGFLLSPNHQRHTERKLCPHVSRHLRETVSQRLPQAFPIKEVGRRELHAFILLAHTHHMDVQIRPGCGREGWISIEPSSAEHLYAEEFQRVIDFLADTSSEKYDERHEFRLNCKNQKIVKRIVEKLEMQHYQVRLERRRHMRFFLIFPKGIRPNR
jgi:hypothetical protein